MQLVPLMPPRLQLFDANGHPLAGGKLYTYRPNTAIPLPTYADAGGVAQNTVPVLLASNGMADVWVVPGQSYDVELRSSADVPIWTVDNLTAAAIVPSSSVITRIIDVTQAPYNADSTGNTDASAQIIDAYTDASIAGGGIVWLPGEFAISTELEIPRGVSLAGLGSSGQASAGVWPENVYPSVLRWEGVAGGKMIRLADHWASRIEGLTLDCNDLAEAGLWLDRSPRGGIFRDLLIRRSLEGSGGTAIYLGWPAEAISLSPPSLNLFERVFVVETGSKALILEGSAHNTFVNCEFVGGDDSAIVIATPLHGTDGNDDNQFYGGYVYVTTAGNYAVVNNFPAPVPMGGFFNNFTDVTLVGAAGTTMIYAGNNFGYSYYTRCYLYTGTPYLIQGGGKIHLQDCLFPTASGRPSAFAVTPTGSPFVYVNLEAHTLHMNILDGTVSGLAHTRNGTSLGVSLGTVLLLPGDSMTVTYTAAPTITAVPC